MDEEGIGVRGLLIRHLILPNKIAGTEEILRFIAEELSRETYISLMSQYLPYYLASEYSLLERFGLENGWLQTKGFLGKKIKWV